MKNKIWILFSLVLWSFISCQQEEINDETAVYNKEISLQTSITPRFDVKTRASFEHEGSGKGNFTNGDKISLYITPEGGKTIRRTATLKNNVWNFDDGKLNWGDLKANKALFSAYYPAIETPVGEKYTLQCETNQTFAGHLDASDKVLMTSTYVKAGDPVILQFHHAMHYLEVNLSSNDNKITNNSFINASIWVKAYNSMSLDPATGEITKAGSTIQRIKMTNYGSPRTFRAVICPQPILEEWRNKGWLDITIDSKEFHYNAPLSYNNGTEFKALESGKRFQLNLLVGKKNEVIEDLTDKTIWVTGLQNIPSQTLWGYAYQNMQSLGLKYEPYYGWYDIKKLDATGPQYDDHRLCWAATTSNILHWWYDRNKENIECYFNYKKATDPDYVFPKYNYNSQTHKESGIFDFFKRTCLDRGGYVQQGLKWYLRGDWITNAGDATSTEENAESRKHKAQGGFFGEVFKDATPEEMFRNNGSSYEMGKFIKEALKRGDALGIDHQSMQGAHAITLWGAAFDDQGEVTTIYVCDNNHSDAELNQGGGIMVPGKEGPYGIFQMRVKRDAPNAGTFSLQSSSSGEYSIYIYDLHAVSQGQTAWDRFWAKHPDYAPKKK